MSNALTIKSGGGLTVKSAGSLTIKDSGGAASLILNLDAADPASYSGTGTVWSDLQGDHDATLSGAVSWNAAGYFTFDGGEWGAEAAATISLVSDLPYKKRARTLSMWVNHNRGSENWAFSYGSPSTNNAFLLGVQGGNYAMAGWANDLQSTTPVDLNTWVYQAVTYDGTTVKLYLNGALIDQGNRSFRTLQSEAAVGRQIGVPVFFNGSVAQVSLYDGALTGAEILAEYNATKDQARFA